MRGVLQKENITKVKRELGFEITVHKMENNFYMFHALYILAFIYKSQIPLTYSTVSRDPQGLLS